MKYQVIQRLRTINGHRGPILEIELFIDESVARDRAGALRDSNPQNIVSLRRVGCVIPDTARSSAMNTRLVMYDSQLIFLKGRTADAESLEERHGRGRP
jgi:hypothetical protein